MLSNLGTFMPRIQEASRGRYGALLFATYPVVPGIAQFATLRSARLERANGQALEAPGIE